MNANSLTKPVTVWRCTFRRWSPIIVIIPIIGLSLTVGFGWCRFVVPAVVVLLLVLPAYRTQCAKNRYMKRTKAKEEKAIRLELYTVTNGKWFADTQSDLLCFIWYEIYRIQNGKKHRNKITAIAAGFGRRCWIVVPIIVVALCCRLRWSLHWLYKWKQITRQKLEHNWQKNLKEYFRKKFSQWNCYLQHHHPIHLPFLKRRIKFAQFNRFAAIKTKL